MRRLIKASSHTVELDRRYTMREIEALIGAEVVDSRNLDPQADVDMHVMIFDDLFLDKGLPLNVQATAIYHAAGFSPAQVICGDVVIVPDSDFAI
ncbi:hypothetical protein [Burkholderia pseudomallei]|uniref:hypothetical protein n=1 Tax=Burkholderia pseudomallei TaxID=28450 RepID=UPI00190CB2F0|nr:hypothetical protein [Burkholderia pseudomallei]MBK3333537.1 hypothetical protein [Burkholderia pseudomallei]